MLAPGVTEMYIEVFLLDNLLMNAVICVLAGAVCGRSIRLGRGLLYGTKRK